MRIRRLIAVAAAAGLIAPVVLRADDPADLEIPQYLAEARERTREELVLSLDAYGGRGRVTSCEGDSHPIRYGGLSLGARWRTADQVVVQGDLTIDGHQTGPDAEGDGGHAAEAHVGGVLLVGGEQPGFSFA